MDLHLELGRNMFMSQSKGDTLAPIDASSVASAKAFAALSGRVFLAAIFVLSGVSKVVAPVTIIEYISSTGLPFPVVGFVVAIVIELVGGALLIAGYRTRIVAAGLAAFCVITAVVFHNQFADQNQLTHFFKNVAMAGGLLQVVAFGSGRWSIDAQC